MNFNIATIKSAPTYRLSSTRQMIVFRVLKDSQPYVTFEDIHAGCFPATPIGREEGLYGIPISLIAINNTSIVEGNNKVDVFEGHNEMDRLQLGELNFVITH